MDGGRMGVNGTSGQPVVTSKPRQDGFEPKAVLQALNLGAAAWAGNPACPKDAQGNCQFLAHFAIHLVQQFRFDEVQLKAAKSPRLAKQRLANHCLARQLRNLMAVADRGLDVTSDIHVFLEAWRRHQEQVPLWTVAAVEKGH